MQMCSQDSVLASRTMAGWPRTVLIALGLTLGVASARADDGPWCAPELESLPHAVCHFDGGSPGGRRTLVIFLHGVIDPSSTWQWTQQRGMVRGAKRLGFSVIAPRGRRGLGPASMGD